MGVRATNTLLCCQSEDGEPTLEMILVELDKNNADMSSVSPNNIYNLMYDIGKIETLVSSISLLLKVMNIN